MYEGESGNWKNQKLSRTAIKCREVNLWELWSYFGCCKALAENFHRRGWERDCFRFVMFRLRWRCLFREHFRRVTSYGCRLWSFRSRESLEDLYWLEAAIPSPKMQQKLQLDWYCCSRCRLILARTNRSSRSLHCVVQHESILHHSNSARSRWVWGFGSLRSHSALRCNRWWGSWLDRCQYCWCCRCSPRAAASVIDSYSDMMQLKVRQVRKR